MPWFKVDDQLATHPKVASVTIRRGTVDPEAADPDDPTRNIGRGD
jgi:hypothetical protein